MCFTLPWLDWVGENCGKVVHSLLDLGYSGATLAFCVRDTEATHRQLFVTVGMRMDAE